MVTPYLKKMVCLAEQVVQWRMTVAPFSAVRTSTQIGLSLSLSLVTFVWAFFMYITSFTYLTLEFGFLGF